MAREITDALQFFMSVEERATAKSEVDSAGLAAVEAIEDKVDSLLHALLRIAEGVEAVGAALVSLEMSVRK